MTHERAPIKSLREIEQFWSIDDVLDANLALDVWEDLEEKSAQEAERKVRERMR